MGDAVREPRHGDRAVPQVGQHPAGHVAVVLDELALGDVVRGEQHLAGVGQLDGDAGGSHLVAVDVDTAHGVPLARFKNTMTDPAGSRTHVGTSRTTFGGRLVAPQALEPGVAQLAVPRPLREPDLRHHRRLRPVHARPGQVAHAERRRVPLDRRKLAVQAAQRPGVEPGPDLPGVDELAGRVVVAEQQGAQPDAGALRVGEAADDELLVGLALELQPVPAPACPVRRIVALGDEPFPALAARFGVVRLAVVVPVLGVPQRVIERQQPGQHALALPQRQWPDIPAVGVQDVEDVVEDRHPAQQHGVGADDVDARLQQLEAGLRAVERDDLAVDDEAAVALVAQSLVTQRRGDLGIVAGDLLLVAGHQPDTRIGAEREAALAVQLALEQPAGAGEPVLGQGGQLWLEPVRLRGLLRCVLLARPRLRHDGSPFLPGPGPLRSGRVSTSPSGLPGTALLTRRTGPGCSRTLPAMRGTSHRPAGNIRRSCLAPAQRARPPCPACLPS